jgi:hypothetical protein
MALACVFCWHIWTDTYVHRYFGEAGWGELFRRMSFDRPEFVTPTTYWLAMIVMAVSLGGFFLAFAAPWWQERRRSPGSEPPARRGVFSREPSSVGRAAEP